MSKNEFLSALNTVFDADILDSTEYLRHELRSLLLPSDVGEVAPASVLRFTQDLVSDLEVFAPGIDEFSWCLHEPEVLGDVYRQQVLEGANVCIAQTGLCGVESGTATQVRSANENALYEAQGNDAPYFIGCLDVRPLEAASLESETSCRQAKMELVKQLEIFETQGAHGVWVQLTDFDRLPILLDALGLQNTLPCILSVKFDELSCIEIDVLRGYGVCIRFTSLPEVYGALSSLTDLQDKLGCRLIVEVDSLGVSDSDAFDIMHSLRLAGISHVRPGAKMRRHERVLLYAFA